MNSKSYLKYSKIHLRNKLRLNKFRTNSELDLVSKQFTLVAELLEENIVHLNSATSGKTKEQLFMLGFSVAQINKYFIYKPCDNDKNLMKWFLKENLLINDKIITSIDELNRALSYTIAS